jgi:hypothetical protein
VKRTSQRTVVAALLVGAMVAGVAGIAAGACGARTDNSPAPGAAIAELQAFAPLLDASHDTNYTAEYATAEGLVVTVVQAPPRRAYRSMAGTYVVGPDATYLCRSTACERAPGADVMPLAHAQAVSSALDGGFVVPDYALSLVGRAATLPGAKAARGERLIGGKSTNCVTVAVESTPWTACASEAGVLAYFSGTGDHGPTRLELRTFSPTVAPDAFDLPAGATVADVTTLT